MQTLAFMFQRTCQLASLDQLYTSLHTAIVIIIIVIIIVVVLMVMMIIIFNIITIIIIVIVITNFGILINLTMLANLAELSMVIDTEGMN